MIFKGFHHDSEWSQPNQKNIVKIRARRLVIWKKNMKELAEKDEYVGKQIKKSEKLI